MGSPPEAKCSITMNAIGHTAGAASQINPARTASALHTTLASPVSHSTLTADTARQSAAHWAAPRPKTGGIADNLGETRAM